MKQFVTEMQGLARKILDNDPSGEACFSLSCKARRVCLGIMVWFGRISVIP